MQQGTIVGIASGMGGGIGIIRISGENAFLVAGEIFRTRKFVGIDDSKNRNFEETESKKSGILDFF